MWKLGTAVAQRLRCCATNLKVAGSIPAGVIGIFHWHKIPPIALWPWGRLSLKQKWVPGAFPGGKGGRCVRLTTLPPSCAVVMKSGNLNFLEPSGPFQVCNGTALPFTSSRCMWSISVCLFFRSVQHHTWYIHLFITFTTTCFGRSLRSSSVKCYSNIKGKNWGRDTLVVERR